MVKLTDIFPTFDKISGAHEQVTATKKQREILSGLPLSGDLASEWRSYLWVSIQVTEGQAILQDELAGLRGTGKSNHEHLPEFMARILRILLDLSVPSPAQARSQSPAWPSKK